MRCAAATIFAMHSAHACRGCSRRRATSGMHQTWWGFEVRAIIANWEHIMLTVQHTHVKHAATACCLHGAG